MRDNPEPRLGMPILTMKWKLHKATGIEFTRQGKVRGHTKLAGKKGYLVAVRKVCSPKFPRGKRTYRVYVHRAVALLFIGRPGKKHVNHIDGNKQNNRRSNLEYVTRAGNAEHAHRTGLINAKGEGNGRAVLTEKLVRKIRKLDPGAGVPRQKGSKRQVLSKELALVYKVTDVSIMNIWRRITWAHVK